MVNFCRAPNKILFISKHGEFQLNPVFERFPEIGENSLNQEPGSEGAKKSMSNWLKWASLIT